MSLFFFLVKCRCLNMFRVIFFGATLLFLSVKNPSPPLTLKGRTKRLYQLGYVRVPNNKPKFQFTLIAFSADVSLIAQISHGNAKKLKAYCYSGFFFVRLRNVNTQMEETACDHFFNDYYLFE